MERFPGAAIIWDLNNMIRSVWLSGGFAAVLGISFASSPACATVYDWTMAGGLSGSGTITVSSTPTINSTGTGYLVTGMTGDLTSKDFSSSIVGTFSSLAVNNLVYYPAEAGGFVLDDFGLGLSLANNYEIEIGEANGDPGHYNVTCCGSSEPIYDYSLVTFSLGPTGTAAATPELPTWMMMIASLPLLGFLGVRSRRTGAAAAG